ncbi:hypothetical protein D3C72_2304660 [compost metagenome]
MRYINSSGTGEWVSQNSSGGNSQFSGKKIVCFGDSITEFGTYPTQMANRLGATGYNIGFGGCRHFRKRMVVSLSRKSLVKMVDLNQMKCLCDT